MEFIEGLKYVLKKPVLKYSFLTSVPFLILYSLLILIGGYQAKIPDITNSFDVYLISFYLLVTYAIFLIVLLVVYLIKPARHWLQRGNTYFKLILLHIVSFVAAIWFPTDIFVVIYFIPFTTWAGLSAILALLVFHELSKKIQNKISTSLGKSKLNLRFITFLILWGISAGLFFTFYLNYILKPNIPFELQMFGLVGPIFLIVIPIIGIVRFFRERDVKLAVLNSLFVIVYTAFYSVLFMNKTSGIGLGLVPIALWFDFLSSLFLLIYSFGNIGYRFGVKIEKQKNEGEEKTTILFNISEVSGSLILLFVLFIRISSLFISNVANQVSIGPYTAETGGILLQIMACLIGGTIISIKFALNKTQAME